jgi:plasmid maintenance system antidote protein VapI
MLSIDDHLALRDAVRAAMADRHLTGRAVAEPLGVQPKRIHAAINEPVEPGLLIRLGQYLGVWPVRP